MRRRTQERLFRSWLQVRRAKVAIIRTKEMFHMKHRRLAAAGLLALAVTFGATGAANATDDAPPRPGSTIACTIDGKGGDPHPGDPGSARQARRTGEASPGSRVRACGARRTGQVRRDGDHHPRRWPRSAKRRRMRGAARSCLGEAGVTMAEPTGPTFSSEGVQASERRQDHLRPRRGPGEPGRAVGVTFGTNRPVRAIWAVNAVPWTRAR